MTSFILKEQWGKKNRFGHRWMKSQIASALMLQQGYVQRKISNRYVGKKMRRCICEWGCALMLNIKFGLCAYACVCVVTWQLGLSETRLQTPFWWHWVFYFPAATSLTLQINHEIQVPASAVGLSKRTLTLSHTNKGTIHVKNKVWKCGKYTFSFSCDQLTSCYMWSLSQLPMHMCVHISLVYV